jgi:osmotically-inducible protein OsmY
MNNKTSRFIPLIFSAILILTGCTTIVDATTKEPITPDPGQRSLGTYIDDKRLQVIVGVNLKKADPGLREANINVTSFNGVILLTGQVLTQELRLLAAETATAITGVRQVHNELQIKENLAFLARSNDTWLATKIKAALLTNDEIESLRIKVIVEDGTAFLMGLVSQEEANTAAGLISNISGLKEVVRVFEYTE